MYNTQIPRKQLISTLRHAGTFPFFWNVLFSQKMKGALRNLKTHFILQGTWLSCKGFGFGLQSSSPKLYNNTTPT